MRARRREPGGRLPARAFDRKSTLEVLYRLLLQWRDVQEWGIPENQDEEFLCVWNVHVAERLVALPDRVDQHAKRDHVVGILHQGIVVGGDGTEEAVFRHDPQQEIGVRPHASGGAMQYMQDGNAIRGFAVLAYPSEYGNSGIMGLAVNQDGIIFEKDFGEETAATAESLSSFDPDTSWEPVTD